MSTGEPQRTEEASADLPAALLERLLAEARDLCTRVSDDWCGYTDSEGDNDGRCELFAGPRDEAGYRTGTVFAVVEDCACGCFPPSADEMRFIELSRLLLPQLLSSVLSLPGVQPRGAQ